MKNSPLSLESKIPDKVPLVVGINTYDFGSTGMVAISALKGYEQSGYATLLICDEHKGLYKSEYHIGGSWIYRQFNRALCRINGSDGFHNKKATKKLLSFLANKNVAAFHLHNIHSFYLNLPLILQFAEEHQIPVIWTIHDCWFFTGRCSHFQECKNWQRHCGHCPNKAIYPRTFFFDRSAEFLKQKLSLVKSLKDKLIVVCPSEWIARELSYSNFKDVTHQVIHNGISLNQTTVGKTPCDKKRLLFVASPFTERKGLRYAEKLSRELPGDRFELHIVGDIKENCSFGVAAKLYGKVSDRQKLFSIMQNCDIFVNPTLDDNFPMTNLEALSSGIPVITFDTGGSGEAINLETGTIVKKGDYQALKESILKFDPHKYSPEKCIERAALFSEKTMTDSYVALLNYLTKKDSCTTK